MTDVVKRKRQPEGRGGRRVHQRTGTESRLVRVLLPREQWGVLDRMAQGPEQSISGTVSFFVLMVLQDSEQAEAGIIGEDLGDAVSDNGDASQPGGAL